uniref:Uncharacterized protein n=1 Tax=Sphaerodactylus townsendi TaxID=933632 RepID=A0ACB8FLA4_9SAUR
MPTSEPRAIDKCATKIPKLLNQSQTRCTGPRHARKHPLEFSRAAQQSIRLQSGTASTSRLPFLSCVFVETQSLPGKRNGAKQRAGCKVEKETLAAERGQHEEASGRAHSSHKEPAFRSHPILEPHFLPFCTSILAQVRPLPTSRAKPHISPLASRTQAGKTQAPDHSFSTPEFDPDDRKWPNLGFRDQLSPERQEDPSITFLVSDTNPVQNTSAD